LILIQLYEPKLILEKIQTVKQNHNEMLYNILTLNNKIDSLLEKKKRFRKRELNL
jgi:hypothetical protein